MKPGRLGAGLVVASLGLVFLAGCAHKKPQVAAPPPAPKVGATEEGLASWYGNPYHGRATTSGEIYDMEMLTAAHRTLPFGARVRVENLANGREVDVRVNDRGPFVEGRIIDLSRAAARRIQMLGPGTARVRLRVLSLPEEPAAGFFAVQVGSFQNRKNAERLQAKLAREHGSAFIRDYDSPRGRFYRVLVGHESDPAGAESLAAKLRREDLTPFIVRVDEPSAGGRL